MMTMTYPARERAEEMLLLVRKVCSVARTEPSSRGVRALSIPHIHGKAARWKTGRCEGMGRGDH